MERMGEKERERPSSGKEKERESREGEDEVRVRSHARIDALASDCPHLVHRNALSGVRRRDDRVLRSRCVGDRRWVACVPRVAYASRRGPILTAEERAARRVDRDEGVVRCPDVDVARRCSSRRALLLLLPLRLRLSLRPRLRLCLGVRLSLSLGLPRLSLRLRLRLRLTRSGLRSLSASLLGSSLRHLRFRVRALGLSVRPRLRCLRLRSLCRCLCRGAGLRCAAASCHRRANKAASLAHRAHALAVHAR